jgi:ectoine hydroxylase-related dioxygenase (phytanoyl-CoA dioxygenase family)
VLSRIENFCPFHPQLDALVNGPRMMSALEALLGEPAVLFKDKINFKTPGSAGFEPHQDVQAGWYRYADLHLTALVSVDAATPENGCLELAPGWHDRGLIGEHWKPLGERVPDDAYVACPTQPGDVVFFDSFIPHRSAPNATSRARRVLYVTYNRLSAGDHRSRYYADKHASFPPDIEREEDREYVYRV